MTNITNNNAPSDTAALAEIDHTYPGLIQKNIPLAPLTSFQIGGPADFFAEPKTIEQLEKLLTTATQHAIPYYILGGGSNTLFHDKGFRGIVIKPQLKAIAVTDNSITAEAGLPLAQLIQIAAKNNLGGMEVWIGLPGTIGGAVRGNAGAGGKEIKDFLTSATLLDLKEKKIVEHTNADFEFDYRHSMLKNNPHLIVLSATFQFTEKLSTAEQQKTMQEVLAMRQKSQPKGQSAGCAFKNEIDPATHTVYSAGKLIDECGLKGTRIGGIEISTVHGNFLQNVGAATQQDVLDTIALIKKTVKEKRHIDLHEEMQIVGEQ